MKKYQCGSYSCPAGWCNKIKLDAVQNPNRKTYADRGGKAGEIGLLQITKIS